MKEQHLLDPNSNCELFDVYFGHILEDPHDQIYNEAMALVKSCAVEKGLEFDGYFNERWNDFADTIVSFDEEYFDDPSRIELYVYLSAMIDDQILGFLNAVYYFFVQENINRQIIQDRIIHLTKIRGVKF